MDDLEQKKQQLADCIRMLESSDIIDYNGHASFRGDGETLHINIGSCQRSQLRAKDICQIDFMGNLLAGDGNPPLEFHLHAGIYRACPEVNAIVHAHPKWSTFLTMVAVALKNATGDDLVTFAALARGWPFDLWPMKHPLDYLGKDGGGGIGSGPGLVIGAALANHQSPRLTVGILGDGDALMSINALWTAAKYEIPALIVIANNRSYFNDEIHQQKVAEKRNRNDENRWVGQRIDDPAPDIAQLAKGLGVEAIGPIETRDDLAAAMQQAVAAVRAGKPFLVDVVIESNIGREAEVARQEKRK